MRPSIPGCCIEHSQVQITNQDFCHPDSWWRTSGPTSTRAQIRSRYLRQHGPETDGDAAVVAEAAAAAGVFVETVAVVVDDDGDVVPGG